jgi:hypothetical protein
MRPPTLIVLRRRVRGRAQLSNDNRWFFVQLYRFHVSAMIAFVTGAFSGALNALSEHVSGPARSGASSPLFAGNGCSARGTRRIAPWNKRQTKGFLTETEAKGYAKAMISDGNYVAAGTMSPHQPRRRTKQTFSAATPTGCKRFERSTGAVYKKGERVGSWQGFGRDQKLLRIEKYSQNNNSRA